MCAPRFARAESVCPSCESVLLVVVGVSKFYMVAELNSLSLGHEPVGALAGSTGTGVRLNGWSGAVWRFQRQIQK